MRSTLKNRFAAVAALAVTACLASSCSTSSGTSATTESVGPTADSAGAITAADETDPVVLRLGTDDGDDTPGAAQIMHFRDEVSERSGGTITVEPVWHAAGEDQRRWDQKVAGLVLDGDLDLAMVPSRAWDDLGVDSLRAINTPFLITTDSLAADVVTDVDLVAQLTSGLDDVGAESLGLFPEGLRHPFGVRDALRGPADYEGGVVRSAWSRTANAMFGALGAELSDESLDPDTMLGAESSFRITPAGVATGNVVFYPKINVLTARGDLRDDLTEDQWAQLEDAADATGRWVLDTNPTDAEAAAAFCDEAGKISAATPAEIGSLVAATRGVVDDLRQDAATASIIDAVEQLKRDDPAPDYVTSCPERLVDRASELDGSYTFTVTEEEVRAAGGTDQELIDENTGKFTVTFDDGIFVLKQIYSQGPHAGTTWQGTGGLTFDGTRLQLFYSQDSDDWTTADVTIRDDGALVFSQVDGGGDDAQAQALSDAWFTTWPRENG